MDNTNFVVNKTSWHYRWLAFLYSSKYLFNAEHYKGLSYSEFMDEGVEGGRLKYFSDLGSRPWNFCMYWRAVLLWPLVGLMQAMVIMSAIVWMVLQSTWGDIAIFVALLSTIIFAVVVIAFTIAAGEYIRSKISEGNHTKHKPSSLFKTMYKSYKNKYCPAVEYHEND